MSVNNSIKQARLWRSEYAQMAKRGKPFPQDTLDAMALYLSDEPNICDHLGAKPENGSEDAIKEALKVWITTPDGTPVTT